MQNILKTNFTLSNLENFFSFSISMTPVPPIEEGVPPMAPESPYGTHGHMLASQYVHQPLGNFFGCPPMGIQVMFDIQKVIYVSPLNMRVLCY